jgi:hypothetical protein
VKIEHQEYIENKYKFLMERELLRRLDKIESYRNEILIRLKEIER